MDSIRTDTKTIFKLSAPMLLSLILEQLIGLTDIIFLGRVSETSVGAAAIGGIGFYLLTMIAFGYSIASQSLMGEANGAKRFSDLGNVFVQSLIFLMAFSFVVLAALPFCMQPTFQYLVQSQEVRDQAQDYFFWRTIGIAFALISVLFRGFFMSILMPRVLTYSSVAMVLANCILNYFLIFGYGPIPALGITGAAIASTLSEVVVAAFFVGYVFKHKLQKKYDLFVFRGIDKNLQVTLFKLGRWMMLQEAVIMTSWLLFFVWVEHMGERALAISNIVRSVSNLLFIIVHAFGATCGAIGANLLGENRASDIDSMMFRGLRLSFLVTIPCCVLIAVFPDPILALFTNIESLSEASVASVRVMLVGYLFCVPAVHYFSVFGYLGCTRESMIASVITSVAYALYAYAVSRLVSNVAWVWTADSFYYCVLGALVWYFWKNARCRDYCGQY